MTFPKPGCTGGGHHQKLVEAPHHYRVVDKVEVVFCPCCGARLLEGEPWEGYGRLLDQAMA